MASALWTLAYILFNLVICCGKTEIRTLGTVTRSPHFECGPIDHSGTFPLLAAANVVCLAFRCYRYNEQFGMYVVLFRDILHIFVPKI